MAHIDEVNRTCVLLSKVTAANVKNVQRHNEREKAFYSNPDIIPERTPMNVHFKTPDAGYQHMFDRLLKNGEIYTGNLKNLRNRFCEMIITINTAYFQEHGGYEYAKQFYRDAYRVAIDLIGGEKYILSAVMHADELNRAMTEDLGQEVYHYHMHIVFIPVVEKQICWPETCEDENLRGKVKETVMHVSYRKKWNGMPAMDEQGNPVYSQSGKKIFIHGYTLVQDRFLEAMQQAGYTDIQRGERGSSAYHMTMTRFKTLKAQEHLDVLTQRIEQQKKQADVLTGKIRTAQMKSASIEKIEAVEAKPVPLSSRVLLTREEYEQLSNGAQKYVAMEKQESVLQDRLTEALFQNETLLEQVLTLRQELSSYRSVAKNLNEGQLEQENEKLRELVGRYEAVLKNANLKLEPESRNQRAMERA